MFPMEKTELLVEGDKIKVDIKQKKKQTTTIWM